LRVSLFSTLPLARPSMKRSMSSTVERAPPPPKRLEMSTYSLRRSLPSSRT
jgi:hypothetical protein